MFRHKKVVFNKKGKPFKKDKKLYADIYFPTVKKLPKEDLDRKKTVILLIHGLGSDKKSILRTIDKSILKDYVIIIPALEVITYPGRGEKILRETADDIEFYIKKAKEYGENIFLCGHSLGGYLVLYTFSRKKVEHYLKGVCLISTPYSLKDVMFRLSINLVEFLGEKIEDVGYVIRKLKKQIPGLRYSIRKKRVYFHKFKFSTIKDVKELYDSPNMLDFRAPPMPSLIINGIEDKLVNFSHGVMLFQKFKEGKKEAKIVLVPHGNHALLKQRKDITKKIKNWIENILYLEKEKKLSRRRKK